MRGVEGGLTTMPVAGGAGMASCSEAATKFREPRRDEFCEAGRDGREGGLTGIVSLKRSVGGGAATETVGCMDLPLCSGAGVVGADGRTPDDRPITGRAPGRDVRGALGITGVAVAVLVAGADSVAADAAAVAAGVTGTAGGVGTASAGDLADSPNIRRRTLAVPGGGWIALANTGC